MSGVSILGAIIIGIFAGWIAEQVMHRRDGLITNLIVGILGAFVGSFLATSFGIVFYGFVGSLIVSAVGAIVLLWVVNMIRGRPAV